MRPLCPLRGRTIGTIATVPISDVSRRHGGAALASALPVAAQLRRA